MSRGRLFARLDRLENGTPTRASEAMGREVMELLDEYLAQFGEESIVDLLPMFGLAPVPAESGGQ